MPLPLSSEIPPVELTCLGVEVSVRCHGSRAEELRASVAEAWVDCARSPASAAHNPVVVDVLLDGDATTVAEATAAGVLASTDSMIVLHDLSPRITVAVVTRHAGSLVMLHAAGLADPATGATAALVAASGTGKTTATRALGDRLAYVSDETIGISQDLTVLPYPKPLSLLERPGSTLKTQRAASTLGLASLPGTPFLAGVLFLSRDPDGPTLAVEDVPTVRALALLAPQMSYLSRLPRPLHRVADLLERSGGLRHVTYRESASLRETVLEIVCGAA